MTLVRPLCTVSIRRVWALEATSTELHKNNKNADYLFRLFTGQLGGCLCASLVGTHSVVGGGGSPRADRQSSFGNDVLVRHDSSGRFDQTDRRDGRGELGLVVGPWTSGLGTVNGGR